MSHKSTCSAICNSISTITSKQWCVTCTVYLVFLVSSLYICVGMILHKTDNCTILNYTWEQCYYNAESNLYTYKATCSVSIDNITLPALLICYSNFMCDICEYNYYSGTTTVCSANRYRAIMGEYNIYLDPYMYVGIAILVCVLLLPLISISLYVYCTWDEELLYNSIKRVPRNMMRSITE